MAWAIFKDNAWRIKSAGMGGVTGFDLESAQRRLMAVGVDIDIAEDLLTACAAATLRAWHEKDDPDGGED